MRLNRCRERDILDRQGCKTAVDYCTAVTYLPRRHALSQDVLRTDVSGMPLEWIDYRDAVRLHFMGQVAYAFGQTLFSLRGGTNARTGNRTTVQVSSMVATMEPPVASIGSMIRARRSSISGTSFSR